MLVCLLTLTTIKKMSITFCLLINLEEELESQISIIALSRNGCHMTYLHYGMENGMHWFDVIPQEKCISLN
jgi:hypothetical protein